MAGFTTFVDGNVLTNEEVNGYLMDQSIIQCTSATRPGSPHEGMTVYETDTGKLVVYGGTAWSAYANAFSPGVKTANETVNNSTTLQDDNHITHTVVANTTYEVLGHLHFTSPTTADIKFALTKPASTTFHLAFMSYSPGDANAVMRQLVDTDTSIFVDGRGATNSGVIVRGTIKVAGTAGSCTLQWAQSAAVASDTILYAKSFINLRRIA